MSDHHMPSTANTREHYRDPNLDDETALRLMLVAAHDVRRQALASRSALLEVGIAMSHPVCRWLDQMAAQSTVLIDQKRLPSDWIDVHPRAY